MLLMATFIAEPEKLQMNWPNASGSTIADAAATAFSAPLGAARRGVGGGGTDP
jgi:hypothetical protein